MHVGCVSGTRQLGGSCSGSVWSSHVLAVWCVQERVSIVGKGRERMQWWVE